MRRPLCLCCLVFAIAIFLLQGVKKPPAIWESWEDGQYITVTGKISRKEIETSDYYGEQFVLYLQDISSIQFQKNNKTISYGKSRGSAGHIPGVLCKVQKNGTEPKLGSVVSVSGKLALFQGAAVPGGFDARAYYAVQNCAFQVKKAEMLQQGREYDRVGELFGCWRQSLGDILVEVLGEKDGGILKAMLLGEKRELEPETKRLYQEAAISHILCISGLHITFLGMGLYRLLRKTPLPEIVVISFCICVIACYGEMTGMGSSALRAIVMFAMSLLAKAVGRSYDMLTALMVSGVWILFEQPLYSRHSGFLLSFGAVLGIGLVTPALRLRGNQTIGKRFWNPFCGGLGVFLMTLPVVVQNFYEVAPYSLLLNLLVIPLSGILLPAGLAVWGFYGIWEPLAQIPAMVCQCILAVYEQGGLLNQRLPGSRMTVGCAKVWQIALYYLLLGLFVIGRSKKACKETEESRQRREQNPLWKKSAQAVLPLVAVVVLLWRPGIDGICVTMLDVGQGDCFLVRQGKTAMLIDGGSSSQKEVGQWRILPALKYYGIRELDYLFVSHADGDHINGLVELLEAGEIRCSVLGIPKCGEDMEKAENLGTQPAGEAGQSEPQKSMEQLKEATKKQVGKPPVIVSLEMGDALHAGQLSGVVLHPTRGESFPDKNSTSLVLLLSGQGAEFLFMGDLPEEKEPLVCKAYEQYGTKDEAVGLLKAGHHGSNSSTTMELLQTFQPQLTFLSCGKNNTYGHPGKDMLERLEEVECPVIVSAWDGSQEFWAKEGKVLVRGVP